MNSGYGSSGGGSTDVVCEVVDVQIIRMIMIAMVVVILWWGCTDSGSNRW